MVSLLYFNTVAVTFGNVIQETMNLGIGWELLDPSNSGKEERISWSHLNDPLKWPRRIRPSNTAFERMRPLNWDTPLVLLTFIHGCILQENKKQNQFWLVMLLLVMFACQNNSINVQRLLLFASVGRWSYNSLQFSIQYLKLFGEFNLWHDWNIPDMATWYIQHHNYISQNHMLLFNGCL